MKTNWKQILSYVVLGQEWWHWDSKYLTIGMASVLTNQSRTLASKKTWYLWAPGPIIGSVHAGTLPGCWETLVKEAGEILEEKRAEHKVAGSHTLHSFDLFQINPLLSFTGHCRVSFQWHSCIVMHFQGSWSETHWTSSWQVKMF